MSLFCYCIIFIDILLLLFSLILHCHSIACLILYLDCVFTILEMCYYCIDPIIIIIVMLMNHKHFNIVVFDTTLLYAVLTVASLMNLSRLSCVLYIYKFLFSIWYPNSWQYILLHLKLVLLLSHFHWVATLILLTNTNVHNQINMN